MSELDELLHEAEDLPGYAEHLLRIRTKASEVLPLRFNAAQRKVHAALEQQKRETGRVRAIILKARQEGISTYVAARFYQQAHLYPERSGLIIADLKKRSEALWDIYDRYDKNMPEVLRWDVPGKRKRQEMQFASGSQIRVETAEDTAIGRALTLHMVHASELAFWDHAEEVWTALVQAVPMTGGEIIIESTAYGVGNFFHRMWEEGLQGQSWLPIFLPWWTHEEYEVVPTPEEVEAIFDSEHPFERRALDEGIPLDGEPVKLNLRKLAWRRRIIRDYFSGDERSFRQEYPAEPEEAFLAAGNSFFEEELLERLRRSAISPVLRGNIIRSGGIRIGHASGGYLRVYQRPSLQDHYVIGVDTASGRLVGPHADVASERGGRDFSCAQVIRLERIERDEQGRATVYPAGQVAELHGRMVPEVFADHVEALGKLYSCPVPGSRTVRSPALIAVERNHSSGETVLRILADRKYPSLYVHRRAIRTYGRPTRELGWVTDTESRRMMLDEFASQVRSGALDVTSADAVREMRTFVLGEDGKPAAQEGCHDDRVMALAIANQMRRYHGRHGSEQPVAPVKVAATPTGL